MKEEVRIRSSKIVDSLSWIHKFRRRTSSIFYIHSIIKFIKNGITTIVTRFYGPITQTIRNPLVGDAC